MPDALLTNPSAAFAIPSDYTTWKDKDSRPIVYPQQVETFESNAAFSVGDVVEFVAPTTTTPLRVKKFANADLGHFAVGVALQAATAAGQKIQVCVWGFCLVNVGSATPAATNLAVKSGTDGQAAVSGTVDATLVVGTVLGTFLGAKDANNQAPLWFLPR